MAWTLNRPRTRGDVAGAWAYRGAMAVADREERARRARSRGGCGVTRRGSRRLERARLNGEDLERLAVAAYMLGSDEACEEGWLAAHRAWLRRGEAERAAGCAFRHALGLFFRGDLAPAMGWVARGGRLLEGPARQRRAGVAGMLSALPLLFGGDPTRLSGLVEAGEIAERLADADAVMFARLCRGYALIVEGGSLTAWRCWTR